MADGDSSAATASTYVPKEIPSSKQRRYGFACAVAECSNNHGKGHTMHRFPDDTETRRQWVKFVQTSRADFGPKFGTPNQNSRICSLHFNSDCYPAKVALAASFGLNTSCRLVPKSVPTVQKPCRLLPLTATSLLTATKSSTVTSVSRARCTVTELTMAITTPICTTTVGQSVSRGAFAKRERQRVVADMLAGATPDIQSCDDSTDSPQTHIDVIVTDQPLSDTLHVSTQTEMHCKVKRNKKVQVTPRPSSTATKSVQCDLRQSLPGINKGTQCCIDVYRSRDRSPDNDSDPPGSDPESHISEPEQDDEYTPSCDEAVDMHSEDDHEMDWTILATLHFNENSNREQATDAYVERLMLRVVDLTSNNTTQEMERYIQEQRGAQPLPPPLCADFEKPNKVEAVAEFKSRFSKF
ncbi:THAP domain-containing protein 10-like [Littorina saxatilis]|uniref:THAP domain-containing protein 10-like n=1 Tax=Littorina saxatilis TaxID=31220 RepID=UPI0038B4E1B6